MSFRQLCSIILMAEAERMGTEMENPEQGG